MGLPIPTDTESGLISTSVELMIFAIKEETNGSGQFCMYKNCRIHLKTHEKPIFISDVGTVLTTSKM